MKKLVAIFTAAVLLFSLSACSSSKDNTTVDLDPEALAEELLTTVTSDKLSQSAESMIPSIYSIDEEEIASAVAYTSSGTTSCEVAVIETVKSDEVSDVKDKFQARVDAQEKLYADYNPTEASRLETAVIESAGNFAVLCVSDDAEEAKSILKENGF